MLIAGLLAGALCACVGAMVVTQGLRTTRAQLEERRSTEQALVTDCLANVDRVIEAPWTAADRAVGHRPYHELDLDHVIDLHHVAPRHASSPLMPPVRLVQSITDEPSIWRAPGVSAPRSVPATA